MDTIFSQPFVEKLGWTLLHFVWQGTAVALLLALLLRILRRSTANLRYIISCAALALMILAPMATILMIAGSAGYGGPIEAEASEPPVVMTGNASESPAEEPLGFAEAESFAYVADPTPLAWKDQVRSLLEAAMPYFVVGWMIGVFGLSMWHLGGWTQIQFLKRRMVKPVDISWQEKLANLTKRLGITRTVRMLESALVEVPTVVGWLKPVILIPASSLMGITSQQLEAILLHELAHIRRFDYLANLLQTLAETLGFYHPAVWWVSRRIRVERENCCDDVAVRALGDKVSYARALTRMEESRKRSPELAVAADGSSLLHRIGRLLGYPGHERTRLSHSWPVAFVLVAAIIVATFVFVNVKAETTVKENADKKWIAKLQDIEGQVEVVEYDVKCEIYLRSPNDDIENTKPSGFFSETHIVVEGGTGKIYKSRRGVYPVVQKLRPNLLSESQKSPVSQLVESFDGETSLEMISSEGSIATKGQIRSEPVINDIGDYHDNGLNYVHPSFYMDMERVGKMMGLTNILKEASEVSFIERAEGVLEVHYLTIKTSSPGNSQLRSVNQRWVKVVLDLKRNGAIKQIVHYYKEPNNPREHIIESITIESTQSSEGWWVPYRSIRIKTNESWPIRKYAFSSFRVNHFDPKENIKRFQLEFPERTVVWDRRSDNRYIVKNGQLERMQATATQPTETLTFGPVIERVLSQVVGESCFIDLDTGEVFPSPSKQMSDVDFFNWITTNRIDAGLQPKVGDRGLLCFNLFTMPYPNDYWEGLRGILARGGREGKLPEFLKPGNMVFLSARGDLPVTYQFITREGGRGVLQILEVKDEARLQRVKIRYKMVQKGQDATKAGADTTVRVRVLEPGTDQPIGGARVQANSPGGRLNGYTDEKGLVEWRVAPGRVHIWFTSPPDNTYVIPMSRGQRPQVQVYADGGVKEITLYAPSKLIPLITVRGRLLLPDGTGANGVKFYTSPVRSLDTTTDEEGMLELRGPIGRKLSLYAQTEDYKHVLATEIAMVDSQADLPTPLTMLWGETAHALFVDERGKPHADMSLKIRPMMGGRRMGRSDREARTDSRGQLKISGIVPGLQYSVRDSRANLSEGGWWKYPHQDVVLIPISEKTGGSQPEAVRAVLSDKMSIRITEPDGRPITILEVLRLFVSIPDGRWTMGGSIDIEGRLPGGLILIDRKHVLLAKPGYQMDITAIGENGVTVDARGVFPDDASNLLTFSTKVPLKQVDADTSSGPDDVAEDEVAGRVIDPESKPVKGAKVSFFPQNPWRPPKWPSVATDSDGVFRVPGFGDSWYTYIQIETPSFAPKWITNLPVGKGFTVRLDNKSRLQGSVVLASGDLAGLTDITLTCQKWTRRGRLGFKVSGIELQRKTDERGRFDFPLEPGMYDIKLENKSGHFGRYPEVVVEQGKTRSLHAKVKPGVRFEARLIDSIAGKPVKDQKVWVEERGHGWMRPKEGSERTSDAQGVVVWESLMPGETIFGIETGRYVRRWSDQDIYAIRSNREIPQRPTLGQAINNPFFELKHDMGLVIIKVEQGVTVTGRVLDPKGWPTANVRVNLAWTGHNRTFTGDSRYESKTDEDGRYTLHLPAGNGVGYNIIAHDYENRWANAVSKPFDSKPGDSFEFDLQMTAGGQISGRVVNSEGKPVVNIEVEAVPDDKRGNPYFHPRALTDTQGRFVINTIRPGEFTVYPDVRKGVNTGKIPETSKRNINVQEGRTTEIGDLLWAGPGQAEFR